jgi:hypothetical protein
MLQMDLSLPWPRSGCRTGLPADARSPSCLLTVAGKCGTRLGWTPNVCNPPARMRVVASPPASRTWKRRLKAHPSCLVGTRGRNKLPSCCPPLLPARKETQYVTKRNKTYIFESRECEKLPLQKEYQMCKQYK